MEITTVGGFSEVGRNMSAVRIKDEVVILDMGLHMENYINFTGDENVEHYTKKELTKVAAIPDDASIKDWKKKVVAIIPSHAHLDHVGAIPYMASVYDAPIICTPYTASVLRAILKDKKLDIPNKIMVVEMGDKVKLSKNITVEFINITHSIPDTALVVLHTTEGQVLYANDFKLDNRPVLGDPPDYDRIMQLGKEGNVHTLIMDSLYAGTPRKTPSESVAREMLKDVMLNVNAKGKAVIVSTFSSHIARLKSIIDFGKQMNRKIIFCGRSLAKYVYAAEDIDLVKFSDDVEIASYRNQIRKALGKVQKEGRDKYLIVATGHQGEPRAVLSRMAGGKMGFKFFEGDHVIFSCTVIPSPSNVANRERLEDNLKDMRVRIFRDIHQSGHGSREDQRDMISMLKPKHIIPAHGGLDKTVHMANLAKEMGYELGKTVHLMHSGQRIEL